MRDTELYRAILGLTPPWTVESVELDMQAGQVVVHYPGPVSATREGSRTDPEVREKTWCWWRDSNPH